MDKRYRIFLAVVLLVGSGLACNFDNNAAPPQGGVEQPEAVQPVQQEPAQPAVQEPAQAAPVVQDTPPPTLPLGLRQGLAGLNSYRLRLHMVFNGPGELDRNDTLMQIAYNKNGDQFSNRTESTSSSADDPEVSSDVSETYLIQGKMCEVSPDDPESSGEVDDVSPAADAMSDAFLYLFDMVVFAENPALVGAETVNGIPSNHFTFEVSGLNSITGAEVTQSQGEYWIANEDDYLVKYSAVVETRTAPPGDASAEVMHLMVEIELSDVDTDFTLTLPVQCQD